MTELCSRRQTLHKGHSLGYAGTNQIIVSYARTLRNQVRWQDMTINDREALLTPEQVAGVLQVHVLTVYSYIRRGNLDAIRLGRTYRIVPEDLEHFIESNRIKKSTGHRGD